MSFKAIEEVNDTNVVHNDTYLFITQKSNANSMLVRGDYYDKINWQKYQIKETDLRQKTMTFTSPQYLDLTNGSYVILLVSRLHQNFGGIILAIDYDEGSGLFEYKCQDFSRDYQSKTAHIGCVPLHRLLITEITQGAIQASGKIPDNLLEEWSPNLAGLMPSYMYDNSLWNNYIKGNPMNNSVQRIIRDISYIEAIRDLTFGNFSFIDVYFDEFGILNITPFNHDEWYNTGLTITTADVTSRKFSFDTTNIITGVWINGDKMDIGYGLHSEQVLGLNLAAFFGSQMASVGSSSNTSSNTSSTKETKKTKKTGTNEKKNKYANNMGSKRKHVWLSADGGTPRSVLNGISKKLQKYGWTTHVNSNIGPGAHSSDIYKVKNGVYSPIYNGICAMTIKELWDGGAYKNAVSRGGVLAPIWWTQNWTNPRGNKPYRYGMENLKKLEKAWDDPSNYCPVLYNPGKQMTKRNIRYCCAPTVSEIVAQFLAGGCVASKKNK